VKKLQFSGQGHNDWVNNPIDGYTMSSMRYVNGDVLKEKAK